jgi:uncharacterized protein involved in type VI secretion and phage assembly
VQYRETHFDFITRLLEEYGIFYFFEHDPDKHLLVFGDGPVNYQPIAGKARLVFNPTAAMVAEEEAVRAIACSKRPRPGKHTLKDFNFEKPGLDLSTEDSGRQDRGREHYDYPGLYAEEGLGRPVVTGRVYHGTNRPPYALPGEKTKSTLKSDSTLGGGGSNELRFEDRKGAEEVYLHGEKDWTIAIENDKNQRIGHDETLSVGNNRDKNVGVDQGETLSTWKRDGVQTEAD